MYYIKLIIISIFFVMISGQSVESYSNYNCKKPSYKPKIWNNKNVRKYNNCYSYAFMDIDETRTKKQQPGKNMKRDKKKYNCNHFNNVLSADHPSLQKTNLETPCPCNNYKIALALDDNKTPNIVDHDDYHFYRQDDNGFWSHKPGGNYVSNVDASGNKITNPENANRNYAHKKNGYNYHIFCGYYCTPYDDTKLQDVSNRLLS